MLRGAHHVGGRQQVHVEHLIDRRWADPATRVVSAPPKPSAAGKGGIALPMLVGICGILLINVAIRVSGTATKARQNQ